MDDEQIDAAILARFPNYAWEDDVPMPSTCWGDGGPLLEQEDICFDRNYAPGGWDGAGAIWRAYWRGRGHPDFGEATADTMLRAGMLAILRKPPNVF